MADTCLNPKKLSDDEKARARRGDETRDRRRPLLPVTPHDGPEIDSGAAGATS